MTPSKSPMLISATKWQIPTPPEGKYTAIVYDTQTKQTKEVSVSKEVGDTIFGRAT